MKTNNSPAIDGALAVVGSLIAAVSALSAATALSDISKAVPVTLAIISAILGAIQVGLRNYVQSKNVPVEDVVEHLNTAGTEVVAGLANNEVPVGSDVRPAA